MKTLHLILLVLPVIFYYLDALLPKGYIFDPVKLQELSKISIETGNGNTTQVMSNLVALLQEEYGSQHVNGMEMDKWFFNNAGGAMGSMLILHASISEYLILFGTPLGTEGHSGVHLAHDYFTILSGEQMRLAPGEIEPTVFRPGDQNYLPRGEATQYVLNGWALELAQGWIPSMLPFGFLDTFTSTLDFYNLWKTVYLTGVNMVGQLLIGKI
ncbi:ERG2/sigma1 receptor-like protein [Pyronema domesticum]|uniref:C-8 sterol isomerase n=1 Tax=Pyronema omphalodes (strain CBS 100304) TaxID=1076935 RepID=U4LKL8_PYROM|nr:ERG2/sigma1 receptor-like protein [Pyronema domesticum]CCX32483.1 Similar to C-8 sterol isomerase; acc. no. P32352 [Pyronema omphalodes CBS 100304]